MPFPYALSSQITASGIDKEVMDFPNLFTIEWRQELRFCSSVVFSAESRPHPNGLGVFLVGVRGEWICVINRKNPDQLQFV